MVPRPEPVLAVTTGSHPHVTLSLACTHSAGCAGTAEVVTLTRVTVGHLVVRAFTVIGRRTYTVAEGKTIKLALAVRSHDAVIFGHVKTLGLALKGHGATRFGTAKRMRVSVAKPGARQK